jgi:hypothetical protein
MESRLTTDLAAFLLVLVQAPCYETRSGELLD